MADTQRTLQEVKNAFKTSRNPQFYDQWADTYSSDHNRMGYKAHKVTAEMVKKYFTLSPDQARVLDVGCGSGFVANELSPSGFRQFVGVDGSQGMLDQARLTGLYQELHLALLGTQPLPVEPETFDVVTIAGVLHRKYIPSVAVVRELCQAAKPGGLVVMTQATYPEDSPYTEELNRELGLMVEQGLWKQLEMKKVEQYLLDPYQPDGWACGSSYVYQKTL